MNMLIQPINTEQQAEVRQETQRYIALAGELLDREFAPIEVKFDLSGTTAGMFKFDGERSPIRYNPWIFAKYYEENLHDTVPHEVAHYIVHSIKGNRRLKPHGREWQSLMQAFGANPSATFKLDLEGIPQRKQRTHDYHCGCRSHEVSTTRHHRMQRGATYLCRYCNGPLKYRGEQGASEVG